MAFCAKGGEPFPLTKADRKLCDRCRRDNVRQNDYYGRLAQISELAQEGYTVEQIGAAC